MKTIANNNQKSQTRIYERADSVVFLKTKERFGGLSNMAGGFPLLVNNISIRTAEALYQACRFPHMPEIQRLIISERSPMTAKMRGKPHRKQSRPDWDAVRVKVMRWCLRVKLAQNWQTFGDLLRETGDMPIVERSRRDDFWGANITDNDSFVGMNVLGRLLMELREQLNADVEERMRVVEPLPIQDFLLLQKPIKVIYGGKDYKYTASLKDRDISINPTPTLAEVSHVSVFDQPGNQQSRIDIRYAKSPQPERKEGLQPYPKMKNSGVEWLGEMPEHWKFERGKWLFMKMERPAHDTDEVITCFRDGVVTLRKKRRTAGFTESIKEIGYQGIRIGDLVIHAMDAAAGAIGVSDSDGKGTPVYAVCQPLPNANPYYYAFVVREMARSQWILALATGIRERSTDFRFGTFSNQRLPLPPLPEQTAIVRYLDYFDRRIQRYVRAKQRLIKLLEEQKKAVIHRAVTRGLDPDVPLKPSGVEWLGDMPAHWEVLPLKHWAGINNMSPCCPNARTLISLLII